VSARAAASQDVSSVATTPGQRVNPVHAHLQRLREAFFDAPTDIEHQPAPTSTAEGVGFEACLLQFLHAAHWVGDERRIRESLPYLQPIDSLETLRAVLARLGFETVARRAKLSDVNAATFPCIGVLNGAPFVALGLNADGDLQHFDTKTDRALNEILATTAEFCFARETQPEAAPDRQGWMSRAVRQLKGPILGLLSLSFAVNLIALGTPLFTMAVYDFVIRAEALSTLWYLFAAALIALVFEMHLRSERSKLVAEIGARFDAALTASLFQRLTELPLRMTESAAVSSQILRFRDFESIRALFTGQLVNAILDLPFAFLFMAVIFYYGGVLGFIPIVLALVYVAAGFIARPVVQRNGQRSGSARNRLQSALMETVTKLPTLRQLDLERAWSARVEAVAAEAAEARFKSQFVDNMLNTFSQSMVMIAGISALGFGALMAMENTLSVGALVAVMMLIWRVLTPIQVAFLSSHKLGQVLTSAKQVNQLMSLQPERKTAAPSKLKRRVEGNVVIDGLAFRYNAATEAALRGVSVQIKAGEVVAVCGPTGAGKTTLLKLLAGLYEPGAGAVYVDGLNLRQMDGVDYRASIGYLPPRARLFHGTIEQNIRLIAPTASPETIARALDMAGVALNHPQLPNGLDTWSRKWGQTQLDESLQTKIALAALFAKTPPILLLDDPGAFLDAEGDAALVAQLEALRGKATIILVTNRPSHMRACDRIIKLESGMVGADGPSAKVLPTLMNS
jgi:ABC-type bacteriocin/lantibiotic exporter with double-glycine peptidase domain